MSRSNQAVFDNRSNRFVLSTFVLRQVAALAGFSLFVALGFAVAALSTWNVSDPSFSYATADAPTNILGYTGAAFADIFMQFFGIASVVALLPVVAWALVLIFSKPFDHILKRAAAWFGGSVLASAALGCIPAPVTWPLPSGLGGVFGDMILRFPALFTGTFPSGTFGTVLGIVLALPAAYFLVYSAGLIGVSDPEEDIAVPTPTPSKARTVRDELEDDESEGIVMVIAGALTHMRFTAQARLRRLFGLSGRRKQASRHYDEPYDFNTDEFGTLNEPVRPKPMSRTERVEPSLDRSERRHVTAPPMLIDDDEEDDFLDAGRRPAGIMPEDDEDDDVAADWAPVPAPRKQPPAQASGRVIPAAPRPKTGQRIERVAQASFVSDE